ncbi:L,D-transpeptidase [Bifidobacterium sp. 82T10]|uniref:L,D-transpeptidase n=2 Tax=Bifidobacterium miconis TaxID=2834435 RepID=A0ABS6WGK0_9BIFI|nr:L,D-transpeptidase [Bifidobacterium miconis]
MYPNLSTVQGLNIEVSLARQRVYVKSGSRTIYTMLASTGMDDSTPHGTYYVQNRGVSFYNSGEGMGANYWVSWKDYGTYLFHTVPTDASGNYIVSEADKLGHPASHGCVRLTVPDAQWLYNQLPEGTKVVIH